MRPRARVACGWPSGSVCRTVRTLLTSERFSVLALRGTVLLAATPLGAAFGRPLTAVTGPRHVLCSRLARQPYRQEAGTRLP